ncbi:MAG TPA: hypothetical protein VG649_01245 [Candidatus Angelobacter sp.]|nr:hypothetical protein [Candidatus Angelobacter sp.]
MQKTETMIAMTAEIICGIVTAIMTETGMTAVTTGITNIRNTTMIMIAMTGAEKKLLATGF